VFRPLRAIALPIFALVACSRAAQPLAPSDARVEREGAFAAASEGGLRCAWPACSFTLRFEGSALTVELSDAPVPDSTPDTDYLAVVLDGEPRDRLDLHKGRQRIELVRNAGPGPHILRLVKRTEAEVGTVTVHAFQLPDGGRWLASEPADPLRMEVLGDSISAGYGVEGREGSCDWRADLENADAAYASVAARLLGASLTLKAWSGKGVARNFDPRDLTPLSPLLPFPLPFEPDVPQVLPAKPPQVVVIHLGTNDFFAGEPDESAFKSAYRALLASVDARAPKARRFLVLSPMLTDGYPAPTSRSILGSWLHALIAEERALGRDAVLVEQRPRDDEPRGCHGHPGALAQARFGRELATMVRMHALSVEPAAK
jgi:lysophospholipase L1-like esterase